MNLNSQKSDIIHSIKKLNYRDLLIFLIPLLIFSIYLNIYNPGILTIESFNQLHQIATGKFTNHHPFFHTFIEMLCIKLFGSTLSIAILQILVFSSMWTVICKYHRDDSDSNSNVFLIQAIITLVICLIPINAVYSITLWKDILFCYFLMFLCFLIKVLIDKNGKVSIKYIIILALTMAFVSQLRQDGIYIIIPTLIILSIYIFMKKPSKRMYAILPALTIIFILMITSLNMAYNVEDVQTDSDFHLNLKDADIVWDITRDGDWKGQVYYINKKGPSIETAKEKYFTSINSTPKENYEDAKDINYGSDKYKSLNSIVTVAKTNIILDTLFNSPALYMYLAIILLVLMQVMFKTKEMYLVYLPNLFNIIIVFLTIPIQENRYLYSNQLVFYLLVIIMISFIFYSKRESGSVSSKPPEVNEKITGNMDKIFEIDNTLNESPKIEAIYQNEDNYADEFLKKEKILQNEKIYEEPIGEDGDLIDEILKEMEMEKKNE